MKSYGMGIEFEPVNVVTVFVAGHGRIDDHRSVALPHGVRVEWFANKGDPVSKAYTKGVLQGKLPLIAADVGGGLINRHYSCESVPLEMDARSTAFQAGPWNENNTYLVQAKTDVSVDLCDIIRYFRQNKPADRYCFKWAVCRSSIHRRSTMLHTYKDGVVGRHVRTGSAPLGLGSVSNGDIADLIYVEKKGCKLNYFRTRSNAMKNRLTSVVANSPYV